MTDYSLKRITANDRQEIQQLLKQHLPQESEVLEKLEEKEQKISELQNKLIDVCSSFYPCSDSLKRLFPNKMGDPMSEVSHFLLD